MIYDPIIKSISLVDEKGNKTIINQTKKLMPLDSLTVKLKTTKNNKLPIGKLQVIKF